ncbi:MAG: DUF4391 domain-containing protein [Metamycoplasmataceae bacterium]
MFKFNSNTNINQNMPLKDIQKKFKLSKQAKEQDSLVISFTLSNILSAEKLNCEISNNIDEIQIYNMNLNSSIIPLKLIEEIDQKNKTNCLYIFYYENKIFPLISYKNMNLKPKIFKLDWIDDPFYEIPFFINIWDIYKFMLSKFFIYDFKENETIDEYINRNNKLIKLEKEIVIIETKIKRENQPKKIFEMNNQLKEKRELIKSLV